MVLGQPDTRSLVLLTSRRTATSKTATDHTEPPGEPRPLWLPHREELMPMIERTTGYPAAHDFGAVGYPVIGAADITLSGDIKNDS